MVKIPPATHLNVLASAGGAGSRGRAARRGASAASEMDINMLMHVIYQAHGACAERQTRATQIVRHTAGCRISLEGSSPRGRTARRRGREAPDCYTRTGRTREDSSARVISETHRGALGARGHDRHTA